MTKNNNNNINNTSSNVDRATACALPLTQISHVFLYFSLNSCICRLIKLFSVVFFGVIEAVKLNPARFAYENTFIFLLFIFHSIFHNHNVQKSNDLIQLKIENEQKWNFVGFWVVATATAALLASANVCDKFDAVEMTHVVGQVSTKNQIDTYILNACWHCQAPTTVIIVWAFNGIWFFAFAHTQRIAHNIVRWKSGQKTLATRFSFILFFRFRVSRFLVNCYRHNATERHDFRGI